MTPLEMADALSRDPDYRVLRRIQPRSIIPAHGTETRRALFVDTETTGLDPASDEIIELAMTPFTYSTDGRIFEIDDSYRGLRQPSKPIPPEITAINGITNEMVAGQKIDVDEVAHFADGAAPIIAHNAAFDRKFVEKLCPAFATKPWACSMSQVNWAAEGYEGTRLAYLIMEAGLFYDRHQATADCLAGITLLTTTLPKSGTLAFSQLLGRGRRHTWRIWATGSPFETKDALKARGYAWHAGKKSWHTAVDEAARDAEIAWLCSDVYRRAVVPPMDRITAFDRFSAREIPA